MPIIPATALQGAVGSAERFIPSSLPGQLLPGGIQPYLTKIEPTPIASGSQADLDARLTVNGSRDYTGFEGATGCGFWSRTFGLCPEADLEISPPTVNTTNRGSEIAREVAVFNQDNQIKSFGDRLAGTNLFVLMAVPFMLFFIARKYLR